MELNSRTLEQIRYNFNFDPSLNESKKSRVYNFRHIFEILEGKGPMSSTGIEALLYMKTNNSIDSDPEYPDIEVLQSFATVAFDTCNLLLILF